MIVEEQGRSARCWSTRSPGDAWKQAPEGTRRGARRSAPRPRRRRRRRRARDRRPKQRQQRGRGAASDWRCGALNAQKLIEAGAVVTVGTDNYWAAAPEFSRTPKPGNQDHGIGTIIGHRRAGRARHDARAGDRRRDEERRHRVAGLDEFGTIETGKRADCWCSTPTRSRTSATSASCRS